MRLIIAGGGTGGHLFPALAVARAVKTEDPGGNILFVGTEHGIEAKLIPQTEFPIRYIRARGLRGTGFMNKIRGFSELPAAVMQSLSIIRGFRPSCVLGVGGYASGPTLAAAVLTRVPTAIQEQNCVMGTTNRVLARFVDRVFISWEDTEPRTPPEKTVLAGNPVRDDFLQAVTSENTTGEFHLLIFGGSRGAVGINRAVSGNLEQLKPMAERLRILHQTGEGSALEIRQAYDQAGIQADVREFIHDMGTAYQWADMVVCRSGASTLAELTAVGKPAIVVPYPYAIGDHQAKNARILEKGGAVLVVPDAHLKNGALTEAVRGLIDNPDRLAAMAQNSRKFGRPDAARCIARELLAVERSGA